MENVYLFYNVFSWWFVFWVFFYVIKILPIEPFIAILLTVLWDMYALLFHQSKEIPVETEQQKWVQSFRMFLLITAHWVPFFTLPVKITKKSLGFLLLLAVLYTIFLNVQGLSIFNIYDYKNISGQEMKTFHDLFMLRFNNYFVATICLSILMYTGYTLLKNPYKDSLVYKYKNR
tara:strand:+ start:190 stop:714 length:525 start_codon:yes stop_codon:yes gene_type:complete